MFCLFLTDVNFIASPPSMVAAGSVVAAVQGLYLKNHDASLSSQNLTNFLSQVIRSDPVWSHTHTPKEIWCMSRVEHCSGFLTRRRPVHTQDCLRSCQEQIESLLESSLRQAQLHSGTTETKHVDEEVDLSCTPTDVRDVNIWGGLVVTSHDKPHGKEGVVLRGSWLEGWGGVASSQLCIPSSVLLPPGGLLSWPITSLTCPLSTAAAKTRRSSPACHAKHPESHFQPVSPSSLGNQLNTTEVRQDWTWTACEGWSWSHRSRYFSRYFSHSLTY